MLLVYIHRLCEIKNSIYTKIETGYAFERHMNNGLFEKSVNQISTQGSAMLKIKCYNPKKLLVQHLPVKEEGKKIEINRMRNGYITQVLTSVDIQEIAKIGGKVIRNHEGVIFREIYKVSPFKKVMDKLFELQQKRRKY